MLVLLLIANTTKLPFHGKIIFYIGFHLKANPLIWINANVSPRFDAIMQYGALSFCFSILEHNENLMVRLRRKTIKMLSIRRVEKGNGYKSKIGLINFLAIVHSTFIREGENYS